MKRNKLICAARGCEGCAVCRMLTPWFGPDTRPLITREGEYETVGFDPKIEPIYKSVWREGVWYWPSGQMHVVQNRYWRGLSAPAQNAKDGEHGE